MHPCRMRDVLSCKGLQLLNSMMGCINQKATDKGNAFMVRQMDKWGIGKGVRVKELKTTASARQTLDQQDNENSRGRRR